MACTVVKLAILVLMLGWFSSLPMGCSFLSFPFGSLATASRHHTDVWTRCQGHTSGYVLWTQTYFSVSFCLVLQLVIFCSFLCFPSRQLGICTGAASYWCSSSPWEVILWREPFRWRSPYYQGMSCLVLVFKYLCMSFSVHVFLYFKTN